MTILHWAVQSQDIPLARLLIAQGADLAAKDCEDQTPLHKVCSTEMAELLFAAGADVNAEDNEGKTPLYEVGILPFTICFGPSPYVDLNLMRTLLANGADANTRDEDGRTILHWAAATDCLDAAAIVVAAGANVNARDPQTGQTILLLAISTAYEQLAEIPYDAGDAELQVQDVHRRLLEWAELLISAGADISARDEEGEECSLDGSVERQRRTCPASAPCGGGRERGR